MATQYSASIKALDSKAFSKWFRRTYPHRAAEWEAEYERLHGKKPEKGKKKKKQ